MGATPVPDSQPSPRDVDAAGDGCGDEGDRCCCSRAEGTDPGAAGGAGGAEGRVTTVVEAVVLVAARSRRRLNVLPTTRRNGAEMAARWSPDARLCRFHPPLDACSLFSRFLADKVYVHIYSHRHRANPKT